MKVVAEQGTADNVYVLRIQGDIDMVSVPDVQRAFEGVLRRGVTNVVLDLAEVAYADSSALSLIVWMDRQLAPRDGRLVLAGASRNVARVLELSGLVGLAPTLSAAEGTDDALAGLNMPRKASAPLWERALSLPSCAESLAQTRNEICDLLSELPIPEPVLFDIRVAVGEALANAIRHGSPRGECDTVEVSVTAYPDRVKLEVTDHGAGFDGRPAVQADPYAPSGRGVLFMRALMDGVEFAHQPGGGTTVTLVKHLEWSEASG